MLTAALIALVIGFVLVVLAWLGTMADPLGGRGPWTLFPKSFFGGLALIVAAAFYIVFD